MPWVTFFQLDTGHSERTDDRLGIAQLKSIADRSGVLEPSFSKTRALAPCRGLCV